LANLNKPTKHARSYIAREGEITTEQEHTASCDINIIMRSIQRGQQVRGGKATNYGHDDMTMDGLAFRIQKANLEAKLLEGQKEFSQEELDLFPKHIQEQFGYSLKKEASTPKGTNDDQNDEQPAEKPPKKQQKKAEKPPEPTEQA